MPLRTPSEIAGLQRTADGIGLEPWRYVNGQIPTGGETRGTNERTDRINRINDQIRERELAERRQREEWAAGAEERDRIEAARTPSVRLGELNELLKESVALSKLLRGKSNEVRRLSDKLSEVKATQLLAETSNDDPMGRAQQIVHCKEAIPLCQRSLEQARSEIDPVEKAISSNCDQLARAAAELLRKLREGRFEELVQAVQHSVAKVMPLDRKTVEGIVENSQTFEDYSVSIPSRAEPEEWAEVIDQLRELSEPKAKKGSRS